MPPQLMRRDGAFERVSNLLAVGSAKSTRLHNKNQEESDCRLHRKIDHLGQILPNLNAYY